MYVYIQAVWIFPLLFRYERSTTMSADTITFEGWAGLDAQACEGQIKYQTLEPKPFDTMMWISRSCMYCGICGSDVSALSGGWGSVEGMAQICGHEIVGEVIRVASKVEDGIMLGSIVGIGAQSDSCRECEFCQGREEDFWQKGVSFL
jgi:D-arabinose 1-dehydrogenase-like Zn-dependent alcohol dehydrogenase